MSADSSLWGEKAPSSVLFLSLPVIPAASGEGCGTCSSSRGSYSNPKIAQALGLTVACSALLSAFLGSGSAARWPSGEEGLHEK